MWLKIEKNVLIGCAKTAKGEIEIPDGVKRVGDFAFAHCHEVTRIIIPRGCKSIGCYALHDCPSLKEVVVPAELTNFGQHVYDKDEDGNIKPKILRNHKPFNHCGLYHMYHYFYTI